MSNQDLLARVAIAGILITYLLWLAVHEHRHGKRARDSKSQHLRIVKLESYPSQNDRLKAIEIDNDNLRLRLDKLEGQNPYERLKKVHPHDR